MTPIEAIAQLKERISQDIIGQERIVERLIIALLANGNILVEGLPGLAKTRAVKSMARNLEAEFSRIQFTPDLLPADITGSDVLVGQSGESEFRFEPGPIFANIVLADEINRAPAKVQAALLEAMEERQVTVSGTSHQMSPLFMVMATQNPIEQEGTYPLPEAQMDRFLLHVYIGYPDESAEAEIIRLVRGEEKRAGGLEGLDEISQQLLFEARAQIQGITVSELVDRYMVDLIFATRYPERYDADLARWIQVGASPRGGLALDKCARARAWLRGREHVLPEDVQDVASDVLRHRIVPSYEADADGISNNDIVTKILELVAVA
ncbi:MAG: MoxR family ATPase [Pseudomonadota bacterium]